MDRTSNSFSGILDNEQAISLWNFGQSSFLPHLIASIIPKIIAVFSETIQWLNLIKILASQHRFGNSYPGAAMKRPIRPYRLLILGAGFSVKAGLPLGDTLLEKIIEAAKFFDKGRWFNILSRDIERVEKFQKSAGSAQKITLENLISFLDIEHHLRLNGSDTYNETGNRSQMVVRNLIAWVLWQQMNKMSESQWSLYTYFANQLQPQDVVISFNYDVVLERAMDKISKPYRLAPTWGPSGEANRNLNDEAVTILKLHGSMDWFDSYPFDGLRGEINRPSGMFRFLTTNKNSRLSYVYAISDVGNYFTEPKRWASMAPLIVSPSHHKIAYLTPLRDLWWGLGQSSGSNLQMAIIGFSMPSHDEYLKQLIFHLVQSYYEFDFGNDKWAKDSLRLVDYRVEEEKRQDFRKSFNFINWSKSEAWFDGFNSECIPFLFGKWFNHSPPSPLNF